MCWYSYMLIGFSRFARLFGAYVGPLGGYLCMSFLPMSLGAMMEQVELHPLTECDILRMFTQLAEAVVCEFIDLNCVLYLTAATDMHNAGFIHTDLNPSNVMLRSAETRPETISEGGSLPKVSVKNLESLVLIQRSDAWSLSTSWSWTSEVRCRPSRRGIL